MEDEKKIENNENEIWWRSGLLLFAQLSGWIAIPVIIGVYLGKWLDQKYQTKPWLFLITVFVAFVISMLGIVREASSAIKEMEKLGNQTKKNNDKKDDQSK